MHCVRLKKTILTLPFCVGARQDNYYFYLDNYFIYYQDYYSHLVLKDSFIIKSFFFAKIK